MEKQKVDLYLCGVKGLAVTNSVLHRYSQHINQVIIAADTGTLDDPENQIKDLFEKNGIKVLKTDPAQIGNIAIAVGWKKLINLPYKQVIVMHDSLLPKYRGWNPLLTALIAGDKKIGASALIANSEMDAGSIVAQESKAIKYPMRLEEAMDIVSKIIQKLVIQVLEQIIKKGKVVGKKQNEKLATYSLWRDEKDFYIDWSQSAERVQRHIDASSYPYAGSRTLFEGTVIKVLNSKTLKSDPKIINRTPGKIWKIVEGKPIVVCGKGLLELTEICDENGKSLLPFTKLRQRFN